MTRPDPSAAPLIVPQRLADLVEAIGDIDAIRASAGHYVQLMPERCAVLSAALGDGDGDSDGSAVFRVAHTLKSSSHMLGLDAVAAAAAHLEEVPTDPERVRGLLAAIARSEGLLEAALDDLTTG